MFQAASCLKEPELPVVIIIIIIIIIMEGCTVEIM